ncbi:MAG: hypothetical protein EXR99_10270 [Gemmataceae bacterium]|nr:hypothetical protein [Gemmataceae bacterium]
MLLTRQFLVLLPLLALLLLAGADLPPKEDFDRNRRLLEKWKDDPEHYRQLLKDQAAFEALPESARNRIRSLDRELDLLEDGDRKRFMEVLRRYGSWVDLLSPANKKLLESASSNDQKLTLVKQILDRNWEERLPKRDRDLLAGLIGEKRSQEIARIREEEKKRREFSSRPRLRPKKLSELPEEVRKFVESIRPRFTQVESDRLARMEKKGGNIAKTILELAEAHPNYPAITPAKEGIITFKELPESMREKLIQARAMAGTKGLDLAKAEGKWPEFALAVTNVIRLNQKEFHYPFGASRVAEFPPGTREFLDEILFPALTTQEKSRLQAAEGKWPDYPQLLVEFARVHMIVIPGISLPGPRELWRFARGTPLP